MVSTHQFILSTDINKNSCPFETGINLIRNSLPIIILNSHINLVMMNKNINFYINVTHWATVHIPILLMNMTKFKLNHLLIQSHEIVTLAGFLYESHILSFIITNIK